MNMVIVTYGLAAVKAYFITEQFQKQDLRFYWKNDSGAIFRSIQNLKDHLERKNKKLVFAMNGGMYKEDNAPPGL